MRGSFQCKALVATARSCSKLKRKTCPTCSVVCLSPAVSTPCWPHMPPDTAAATPCCCCCCCCAVLSPPPRSPGSMRSMCSRRGLPGTACVRRWWGSSPLQRCSSTRSATCTACPWTSCISCWSNGRGSRSGPNPDGLMSALGAATFLQRKGHRGLDGDGAD